MIHPDDKNAAIELSNSLDALAKRANRLKMADAVIGAIEAAHRAAEIDIWNGKPWMRAVKPNGMVDFNGETNAFTAGAWDQIHSKRA